MDEALVRDGRSGRWLHFRNPREVRTATRLEDVLPCLRDVEALTQQRGLWAAGFVSFDASAAFDSALVARQASDFPLLCFALYAPPEEVPPPDREPVPAGAPLHWSPDLAANEYADAIRRIRDYIRAGDTYQVNYTFRLQAPYPGDARALFRRMIRSQGPSFGAFLESRDWSLCSASPELFFRLDGRQLESRPMKGTMPRGLSAEEDAQHALALRDSAKNRAENVMIVDMVRNDLGRIAEAGSVTAPRLFDVERYPTVWQMTGTVRGTTDAGLVNIFRALFPPASITGAPKVRTMQIIAELENAPRKVYTGAIGFVAPGRTMQFNVAIRTVLVDRRRQVAEYGVGGGVVWDSTAESEYEECLTKAAVLTHSRPDFELLETLAWRPAEGFVLLEEHLRRLRQSADYFGYAFREKTVRATLGDLARGWPPEAMRVRLRLAEDGGVQAEAAPLTPLASPYRLRLAREPVDSTDVFLYHKTTVRAQYEKARRSTPDCDDVLLWNERGEVTETCIANVVAELDGARVTPPIRCGLLPGTQRARLLAQGNVAERVIRREDLDRCSRITLINAVRGEWTATWDR
jgi:para-aminobenzoate synthetase / 4-amino-4-deoxychorismate lyase